MNVTVEVVGDESHDLSLGDDATYADVIREVGYSPQEASILVDGSPVPEDRAVDAPRVKLLRLIKGGWDSDAAVQDDSANVAEESVNESIDDSEADDSEAAESKADDQVIDKPPDDDPNDLDFSMPNAGPGPRTMSLSDVDADLAVLLFHRDFLCGNCRKQVEAVCERYAEFTDLGAEVVSVLPEPRDKADAWVDYHDMPYPILADPDNTLAERYGQQVKFGPLGRKFDLLGRMPLVVILDLRREPELLWQQVGSTPVDRPDVDDLLAELRKFA